MGAETYFWEQADSLAVATTRVLAADAVEKVGNGHPGTAISLAPAAYMLWQKIMRHDPADPHWAGRDRFILSCGHSSLTIYIQLFFAGYGLELSDLESLRTWGSLTPGHPEYGHTRGIEITTGPLGQGLASAVGFAYAARYERGLFDPAAPAGESIFDHHIYVVASEGDLEEGVTAESSSLAGLQELGNLIVLFDRNHISIEGNTDIALDENIRLRYEAYGWQVLEVDWLLPNGTYEENLEALHSAFQEAKADTRRPSLIILRTIIGWPSPHKQNTGGIHGAKLGSDEVRALKEALGFDPEKSFYVPPTALEQGRRALERGRRWHQSWDRGFQFWRQENPERAALWDRLQASRTPDDLAAKLPVFPPDKPLATRAASGKIINALAASLPELWGGSSDLAESNNTTILEAESFLPRPVPNTEWVGAPYGRVLHFGIREHAMAAIINGIVLHGPTRPFGGTFFCFSDYMRPAVRLAALMNIPSIFVWTHDSIGLGEDGPTHQPVEHLWALRAIPNLRVIRPADANETAWAWKKILEQRGGPSGLVLSRQALPVFDRNDPDFPLASAQLTERGAYVLAEASGGQPQLILIGTGSEVQVALQAKTILEGRGVPTRVVSAPCLEWFEDQEPSYREQVLPPQVRARVSVEAGLALGWPKYVGENGRSVSVETYGASADAVTLFEKYDITADAVVQAAHESLTQKS